MKRKTFLQRIALGGTGILLAPKLMATDSFQTVSRKPLILSTWDHGFVSNEQAWNTLMTTNNMLDAVEQGVRVAESDPKVSSVGYGGLPDRDGNVTLDACIMDSNGNAGAVSYLQYIKNPISVARQVMEKTPHIMLSGEGALQFALNNGFKKEDLLTPEALKRWEKWRETSDYKPVINIENHDTIGMLGLDENGNLAAACTTSGLAWKMHGRVGDSPIVGAGLYLDNEVGAATATGKGEAVIKEAGTAIIVEMMRHGYTPQQACEEMVQRIVAKQKDAEDFQVGFLAINKEGQYGAYALHKGFRYAYHSEAVKEMKDSRHHFADVKDTY